MDLVFFCCSLVIGLLRAGTALSYPLLAISNSNSPTVDIMLSVDLIFFCDHDYSV